MSFGFDSIINARIYLPTHTYHLVSFMVQYRRDSSGPPIFHMIPSVGRGRPQFPVPGAMLNLLLPDRTDADRPSTLETLAALSNPHAQHGETLRLLPSTSEPPPCREVKGSQVLRLTQVKIWRGLPRSRGAFPFLEKRGNLCLWRPDGSGSPIRAKVWGWFAVEAWRR
jgi:hypothetical protein